MKQDSSVYASSMRSSIFLFSFILLHRVFS